MNTTLQFAEEIFTHLNRKYFKEKLYLKRFKTKKNCKKFYQQLVNSSEEEISVAIFTATLYHLGVYSKPMGMKWFSSCSKEETEGYLENWKKLTDDYIDWQWEQR